MGREAAASESLIANRAVYKMAWFTVKFPWVGGLKAVVAQLAMSLVRSNRRFVFGLVVLYASLVALSNSLVASWMTTLDHAIRHNITNKKILAASLVDWCLGSKQQDAHKDSINNITPAELFLQAT